MAWLAECKYCEEQTCNTEVCEYCRSLLSRLSDGDTIDGEQIAEKSKELRFRDRESRMLHNIRMTQSIIRMSQKGIDDIGDFQ